MAHVFSLQPQPDAAIREQNSFDTVRRLWSLDLDTIPIAGRVVGLAEYTIKTLRTSWCSQRGWAGCTQTTAVVDPQALKQPHQAIDRITITIISRVGSANENVTPSEHAGPKCYK
jgi:hypothetical protein